MPRIKLGSFELTKEEKEFEKDGDKIAYTDYELNVNGVPIKIMIKKEDKKIFEYALNKKISL